MSLQLKEQLVLICLTELQLFFPPPFTQSSAMLSYSHAAGPQVVYLQTVSPYLQPPLVADSCS